MENVILWDLATEGVSKYVGNLPKRRCSLQLKKEKYVLRYLYTWRLTGTPEVEDSAHAHGGGPVAKTHLTTAHCPADGLGHGSIVSTHGRRRIVGTMIGVAGALLRRVCQAELFKPL
jgi:hypothetical protein